MACTNPNGCDLTSHYTTCEGCYWYRKPIDKDDKEEEEKDDE